MLHPSVSDWFVKGMIAPRLTIAGRDTLLK